MKYAWLLIPVALLIMFAIAAGYGGSPRTRVSRVQRSAATVQVLAAACDCYWSAERDYPDPDPATTKLGAIREFRERYWRNGEWTDEGLNVSLVYLLSHPAKPEPLLDLNWKWFEELTPALEGTDGRKLYRVVDGFGHPIRVRRIPGSPSAMVITSAGPDGDFAEAKDNIEVVLKR